jgi:hypothetical protein
VLDVIKSLIDEMQYVVVVQAVKGHLSFAPVLYQALSPEEPQVVRDVRDGGTENYRQITNTKFLAG